MLCRKPTIVWDDGSSIVTAGTSWLKIGKRGQEPLLTLRGSEATDAFCDFLTKALTRDRSFEQQLGPHALCHIPDKEYPQLTINGRSVKCKADTLIALADWFTPGQCGPIKVLTNGSHLLLGTGRRSVLLLPDQAEKLNRELLETVSSDWTGEKRCLIDNLAYGLSLVLHPSWFGNFELCLEDRGSALTSTTMARHELARLAIAIADAAATVYPGQQAAGKEHHVHL